MDDVFEDEGPDEFDPEVIEQAQQTVQDQEADLEQMRTQALIHLATAYKRVFSGAPMDGDVETVMTDLAEFCSGYTTPHNHLVPSQLNLNIAVGRQSVYFRIMHFVQLRHDVIMNRFL